MSETGKILVRNIDRDVLEGLQTMAEASDRSVEAEARQALRSWVQPQQVAKGSSDRRIELSRRLTTALQQINAAARFQWRPSHVAQGIEEPLAGPVEDWFLGHTEPTFEQLAKVAEFLGVERRWLQHGDGWPFPVHNSNLCRVLEPAVRWLINLPPSPEARAGESQPPPLPEMQRLIFVRSNSIYGELAIVKQRDDYRCVTYSTTLHVSREVGRGGEVSLAWFSVALELLYKLSERARLPKITSWIVPKDSFSRLLEGNLHPLSLESPAMPGLHWWADFWDEEMETKGNHWDGWGKATAYTREVVEDEKDLAQERKLIRSGEHPALAMLNPCG